MCNNQERQQKFSRARMNETPTDYASSSQHCHKKEFKSWEQYSLLNAIKSGGHYAYSVNLYKLSK